MYILSLLLLLLKCILPDFHLPQNVRRHQSIYPYLHHSSLPYGEASDIFHLFRYNIMY